MTAANTVYAQRTAPGAAEKETARKLMEQGRDHADRNDSKAALDAFKAADEIMHVPTTGVMVASEQAKLGLLVEARETLSRLLHAPSAVAEPEPFQRARKVAEELNDALETRIPSLRIVIRGSQEAEVFVDDIPVGAAVRKFPYRLNPGHHAVVARRGQLTARREVDVLQGETQEVVVELADAPAVASDAGIAPDGTARPPSSSGSNTLALLGFGVAGAGIVSGTVTGLLMFSKRSALDDGCTNKECPPPTHGDYSSAYAWATVSTVSFLLAGVGAGVGVYGLVARRSAARSGGHLHMGPWAGISAVGVRGAF